MLKIGRVILGIFAGVGVSEIADMTENGINKTQHVIEKSQQGIGSLFLVVVLMSIVIFVKWIRSK